MKLARVVLTGCLLRAGAVAAQNVQPELRADLIGPSPQYTIGVGLTTTLGYYVRSTAVVAYGPSRSADALADHWRVDVLSRVVLDPFRQQRWGFSIGGGLSVRRRTYLAAIVELEGREIHGVMPAVQLGASGGYRVGVIFRKAVPGRR